MRKRRSPREKRKRKLAALLRAPRFGPDKPDIVRNIRRKALTWLTILCWFLAGSAGVQAAVNSALGGINGINNGTIINGDGTGRARFVLNSVQLGLVKEARDLAGTVLAPNADVASGQEIYFVLYVDNITDVIAYRLTIEDAINEAQFTYIPDSLETTNVASGSDDVARWAGVWTTLTDALGAPDDEASVLDSGGTAGPDYLTVGEVTGQVNQPLQIPAQTQWAIRFRVRVN